MLDAASRPPCKSLFSIWEKSSSKENNSRFSDMAKTLFTYHLHWNRTYFWIILPWFFHLPCVLVAQQKKYLSSHSCRFTTRKGKHVCAPPPEKSKWVRNLISYLDSKKSRGKVIVLQFWHCSAFRVSDLLSLLMHAGAETETLAKVYAPRFNELFRILFHIWRMPLLSPVIHNHYGFISSAFMANRLTVSAEQEHRMTRGTTPGLKVSFAWKMTCQSIRLLRNSLNRVKLM